MIKKAPEVDADLFDDLWLQKQFQLVLTLFSQLHNSDLTQL